MSNTKTASGFNLGIYVDVNMHIEVFDSEGKLKWEEFLHNTVTTAGKSGIANQILAAPTLNKAGWLAVGTGTPGSNALGNEIARVAFTSKTALANVVTMVGDFSAGVAVGTITEAGTFDAASTGNMWMSATTSNVIGPADSFTITWTLTIN